MRPIALIISALVPARALRRLPRYTFSPMRCISGFVAAAAVAILLQGEAVAVVTVLGDKDIERALKLAQVVEEKRAQFHAPYLVRVDNATVEQIEVVTEFRRYVLITQDQLRQGNWLFAQGVRNAKEKLQPWRERLSIVARLRFHPHNTLMMVPLYDITIDQPLLVPVDIVRTPITALLSGKKGDFNTPLMGATIEAIFDTRSLDPAAKGVSVLLAAQPVARVPIAFAKLE